MEPAKTEATPQTQTKPKEVHVPNPECVKRKLKIDLEGEVKILNGLPERFGGLRNRTAKKFASLKEKITELGKLLFTGC